jgi:hypothetical protein
MPFEEASIAAWAWVAEAKGLDGSHLEKAECAAFDFELREEIRVALFRPFRHDNVLDAVRRIQFLAPTGEVVPDLIVGTVLFHTILMSRQAWTGGLDWQVRERDEMPLPRFTGDDYINAARGH